MTVREFKRILKESQDCDEETKKSLGALLLSPLKQLNA